MKNNPRDNTFAIMLLLFAIAHPFADACTPSVLLAGGMALICVPVFKRMVFSQMALDSACIHNFHYAVNNCKEHLHYTVNMLSFFLKETLQCVIT